jgi:ankyrin repeat protein
MALSGRYYGERDEGKSLISLLRDHGARECTQAFLDALNRLQVEQVKALLSEQPELVDCTLRDGSPLWMALNKKDPVLTELLLEKGARLGKREAQLLDSRPFDDVKSGMAMAELLTTRGIISKKAVYDILLRKAVWEGNAAITSRLIAMGANVNGCGDYGNTPLHSAVKSGKSTVIELLILKGAHVDARDREDETSLHYAACGNHARAAEILISHGAVVNARDRHGETPFIKAVERAHFPMARLLASRGADLAPAFRNGTPVLHYAASSGQQELASLLLSKGFALEEKNSVGWTPLHCAAYSGHTGMVRFLLARHADPKACNGCGETPLMCALELKNQEAAALLRAAGAREPARR